MDDKIDKIIENFKKESQKKDILQEIFDDSEFSKKRGSDQKWTKFNINEINKPQLYKKIIILSAKEKQRVFTKVWNDKSPQKYTTNLKWWLAIVATAASEFSENHFCKKKEKIISTALEVNDGYFLDYIGQVMAFFFNVGEHPVLNTKNA